MFRSRLTVSLVSLATAGAVAATALAQPASEKLITTRVTVVATEYHFALSKRVVPRGLVIFTVTNKGTIAHDFSIIGSKKTPFLRPRQTVRLRVTFTRARRYSYLCTVPRHAEAGMQGTLVVR